MQIDPRAYRSTMGLFATGVTVITVDAGETVHGMTANSLTSVSLDPLLLLVCIDRRARMAPIIVEAERFAVNILRADQEPISRHFAGRPDPALPLHYTRLAGAPVLADSMGALVCRVERILDGGDHLIVLGAVEALHTAATAADPLLYFKGQYRKLEGAA
jgi:flavin reductase (DIM6/NTAB) family NADH-FMN oxidoreductase RutF